MSGIIVSPVQARPPPSPGLGASAVKPSPQALQALGGGGRAGPADAVEEEDEGGWTSTAHAPGAEERAAEAGGGAAEEEMDIFAEQGAVRGGAEGAGGEGGEADAMADDAEVLPADGDHSETEGDVPPEDARGAFTYELAEDAPEAPEDGGEDSDGRGSPELGSYGYPTQPPPTPHP